MKRKRAPSKAKAKADDDVIGNNNAGEAPVVTKRKVAGTYRPKWLGEQRDPPKHGSKPIPVGKPDCLKNIIFVLSGLNESLTRDEMSELISRYGGLERSAVSGKTNYLVVGFEMEDGRPITEGSKYKKAIEKNVKIINEDVRTSYRQISRSLDVSVGTVHNRIDKMIKSGVIKKFSPVIDHRKLGYVLTTIIGVRVKGGKLKNWEEKTFFNKNVVGIYDVTGEYDAFLIAKFKDTDELNSFIKELLKDPIIERTYTQTVLDVIKEDMGSSNIL